MKIEDLKNISLFKNKKLNNLTLLKNQGYCNTNYLLKTKKTKYIVRELNSSKNFNRKDEFLIQNLAAKYSLANKILYMKNGIMIYKYVKGEHLDNLYKKNLKLLAFKIKKIHNLNINVQTHNFNDDLKYYQKKLDKKNSKKILKKFKTSILKLKQFKPNIALCHHDLNKKNLLFNDNNLKFIDWEFSRKNDIFFDIATICIEFNFNKKKQKQFLKYYFKKIDKKIKKKLKIYKRIYKYQKKLWFIL